MRNFTYYRLINEWAEDVLSQYEMLVGYKISEFVPIDDIANRLLGLRCEPTELGGRFIDAYGVFIKELNWIFINQKNHLHMQRLTIAHEIAHRLIERDPPTKIAHSLESVTGLKTKNLIKREQIANYFGAALLMPKTLMLPEILSEKWLNDQNLRKLSHKFRVSPKMLRVRIENLQIMSENSNPDAEPEAGQTQKYGDISFPLSPAFRDFEIFVGKIVVIEPEFDIFDHVIIRSIKNIKKFAKNVYLVLSKDRIPEEAILSEIPEIDGFVRLSEKLGHAEKQFIRFHLSKLGGATFVSLSNRKWVQNTIIENKGWLIGNEIPAFTVYTNSPSEKQKYRQQKLISVASLLNSDVNVNYRKEAIQFVREIKKEEKKVVLVTGCFDIIRVGHIRFLQEAKKRGDVLLVGVESDSRVRHFKGHFRPYNTIYHRIEVLQAFAGIVDFIFVIAGSTKRNLDEFYSKLHQQIKPDIYAISENDEHEEGKRRQVHSAGGELAIVSKYYSGVSSTTSLQKIIASSPSLDLSIALKKPKEVPARNAEEIPEQLTLPF